MPVPALRLIQYGAVPASSTPDSEPGTSLEELRAELDARGLTAEFVAAVLASLGGPVASVTAPVAIDLTQEVNDVKTATVGGALAGSWSVAWGRVALDRLTRTLRVWGPRNTSETVASQVFTVDSGTNPTSRR